MKNKKRESIYAVVFPILALLIITTAIISNYEKDCYYSESCFNQAFHDCAKAKVIAYQNDNTFEYRILNQEDEYCMVEVKIIEVNPQVDSATQEAFKDKDMLCKLPIAEGFTTDKLNYCEGPLKEAIYELTIQKMYKLLANNLGEIISQMRG